MNNILVSKDWGLNKFDNYIDALQEDLDFEFLESSVKDHLMTCYLHDMNH